jgi:hypothetical protein
MRLVDSLWLKSNGKPMKSAMATCAGQTAERFDLAFASIFHVDDPAVKDVPKQKDAIAAAPENTPPRSQEF